MKKHTLILIIIILTVFVSYRQAYAHSTRHHMIDMGKNLVKCAFSPLYGIFIKGPKNVKEAYQYEVHGLEKPEKRNHFSNRVVAAWRAPGEEAKGIIDGLVDSAKTGGQALKEFISIFFGD